MKLFHYHYWTPYVKNMEIFYKDLGFEVFSRNGYVNGSIQPIDRLLSWEEIEKLGIIFRIIEMRRGQINVTFGEGKKIIFDHIGFLSSLNDYEEICKRATARNWRTDISKRRTFLKANVPFRIELQNRSGYINTNTSLQITQMNINLLKEIDIEELAYVLGTVCDSHELIGDGWRIVFKFGQEQSCIDRIRISDKEQYELIDPAFVYIES